MGKGSQYERDVCRQLSLWWTGGKNDSVFWRTSQSGGRATQRAKSGRKTFGQYGDIAAVDPIGLPLVKLFTIELKRGRSHGCPNDLLDCRPSTKPKPFELALLQARDAAVRAGTPCWMLVSRRDGRVSMVYVDAHALHYLPHIKNPKLGTDGGGHTIRCKLRLCEGRLLHFFGMQLEEFLRRVEPSQIIAALA